jgi:hypothetical protein
MIGGVGNAQSTPVYVRIRAMNGSKMLLAAVLFAALPTSASAQSGKNQGLTLNFWIPVAISAAGVLVGLFSHALTRRAQEEERWKQFRELQTRFWDDKRMAEVRMWIASDQSYETVRPTFERRMVDVGRNSLSIEDNQILEKMDVYCALITQVRRVQGLKRLTEVERDAWLHAFDSYWVRTIGQRRQALESYMTQFWPKIFPSPIDRH